MKKILLIVITALISVSTALSLEPMKVAFVYTAGTPTSVQVQLADNTSSNLFQGENYTTGITPNSSGVIVVNVRDHVGSAGAWAAVSASSVTTYTTLDIYVNGTLYAQYRLDALILAQAQNGILDQDGNLTPSESGSGNIGTDKLRWKGAYFEGNTVHIGPADGEAVSDELAFSYDDGTNTATMTVATGNILTATATEVTIDGITVGQGAGNGNTNTAVGASALSANTTGYSNTAFGNNALSSNTTGVENTAIGESALGSNENGGSNTATGEYALNSNTSGNRNTATGESALRSNDTGSDNTAIGHDAMRNNTSGAANTAIGREAMFDNETGIYNTAIGIRAFENATNESNSVGVGNRAGASLLTGGSGNVFLGVNAGSNASQKTDAQNSIAIGANTYTTANNQVVIGNSSITETQLRGATLVDLAGGGTQNIQVDNTGKLVPNNSVKTINVSYGGSNTHYQNLSYLARIVILENANGSVTNETLGNPSLSSSYFNLITIVNTSGESVTLSDVVGTPILANGDVRTFYYIQGNWYVEN